MPLNAGYGMLIHTKSRRTIFLLVVCSSDKEIRIRTETYKENFDGLYRKPYYYTAASEQSFAAFSFILLQIFSFPVTFNIFFLDAYNQYIIGI